MVREELRMEKLQNVLSNCFLEDLGYDGPWFTWEWGNIVGNNIHERLDRGVATSAW